MHHKYFRICVVSYLLQLHPFSLLHIWYRTIAQLWLIQSVNWNILWMWSPLTFFSPAMVIPLIVTALFSLKIMWDSRILLFWSLFRSIYFFDLKVSLKCSCFILYISGDRHFPFQHFMPTLRYNCIVMTSTASGTSSISSCQRNMWVSGLKVSSHSIWVFIVSYFLPDILGI